MSATTCKEADEIMTRSALRRNPHAKAKFLLLSYGIVLATACVAVGRKVELYEAGRTPGAHVEAKDVPAAHGAGVLDQQDCKLVVTGTWDISECGTIEMRFADRSAAKKMRFTLELENEAVGPLGPCQRDSSGTFIAHVGLQAGSNETATVIPPAMPELQAAVWRLQAASRMHTMPANGIFCHVWPHSYWTFAEIKKGQMHYIMRWSLDPRKPVARLTLSWRGKKSQAPVSIVARGPGNAVREWPPYAKLGEDRFFPCIDRYGQFRWLDWPGKTHDDEDLARRLAEEDADLAAHPGPASFDKWGGWKDGPKQEATGSFYIKKINGFWWFVDPDGNLWWSCGPLRVSASTAMTFYKGREFCFEWLPPENGDPFSGFYKTRDELMWPYWVKRGITNTFDFSASNLCRKYGDRWREKWADRVHRRLRSWGANTIGNSSDRGIVEMSRTPYVERFEIKSLPIRGGDVNFGWWPLRDPYDASFAANVREQLRARRYQVDDPWCVGFFVDNELPWGFIGNVGRVVWDSPEDQPAKAEFRRWLARRHGATACEPTDDDFKAFSRVVAEEYFRQIRLAFDGCAPKKLYLGCRGMALEYVAKAAEKYVDALSQNWYDRDISDFFNTDPNAGCSGMLDIDRPIVIGEFHCGALDRGVLNATLVPLRDQKERAAVIRQYLTSAITHPRFIGAHWHHFSDEPTFGRFDGEAMQNGWTDVCDTPYPETVEAVRWIGENMYRLRWEASLRRAAASK